MKFETKEQLYKRVTPALRAKRAEFIRRGYDYIKEVDIWNYLALCNWKYSHDLMLSDVVSDIMHVEVNEVDQFLKNKLTTDTRTAVLES